MVENIVYIQIFSHIRFASYIFTQKRKNKDAVKHYSIST